MRRHAARAGAVPAARPVPAAPAETGAPPGAQWSLSAVPAFPSPQGQGKDAPAAGTVQRQEAEPDRLGSLWQKARDLAALPGKLRALTEKPGTGARFSKKDCPEKFCNPFADVAQARADLADVRSGLVYGIESRIDSRVGPLWSLYLDGGATLQDLTATFGADFTASRTTAMITRYLYNSLQRDVRANVQSLIGAAPAVTIDFAERLAPELRSIETPGHQWEMDFSDAFTVPGNIAGGVGGDQAETPIGARPSNFADRRFAVVTAELARTPLGIRVTPAIRFSVTDTIDLCPGNCGGELESEATVPMSRFEASDLAGDVPFEVRFDAPAKLTPFFVIADSGPGAGAVPSREQAPGPGAPADAGDAAAAPA